MRNRISILSPAVKAAYTPEQIVGRGIVLLFAIVGFIDLITMGAMWK